MELAVIYKITPELRAKFKQPFGLLLSGTFSETATKLRDIIEKEKPPLVVSVGDTVSQNLHLYGLKPFLSVTDNQSMRKRTKRSIFEEKKIMRVKNPQGTITDEAFATIQKALEEGDEEHIHIVVDGEEDLLTLVAVLHAPEGSFVVYGQPYTGMVVVKATPEKKTEVKVLLKAMALRKAK
ncbi:MAG TPA: GTP-dependent dephospho-CoA kinase family protein [Candidatus Bathyarchaeia archaeon]